MKKARVAYQKEPVVQVRASSGSVLGTSFLASGAVVSRIVTVERPRKEVKIVTKGEMAEPQVLMLAEGGTFPS